MLDYNSVTFKNFADLKNQQPKLAQRLINYAGDDEDWQDGEITVYDSLADFAKYEIQDGWYAGCDIGSQVDFHGAPNPFNYIDYKALGKALSDSWDVSMHYLDDDTCKVVEFAE